MTSRSRLLIVAVVGGLAVSCRAASREGGAQPQGSEARVVAAVPAERVVSAGPGVWSATADGSVLFHGMCDASAAVRLSDNRIVVANDDDNVLRVYDAAKGGEPLASTDVSAFVGGDSKRRESGDSREEADIEGAALAAGRAFFITSHARGDKGKKDDSLSRFFTVTLGDPGSAVPAGVSYAELRRDLAESPPLLPFRFKKAAKRDPEEEGGLNIEGLALDPGGKDLLVGFRNPLSGTRALVVPLTNGAEVTGSGARAAFGNPYALDLGGRGIRDLAAFAEQVLVVAGPPVQAGDFRLFVWDVPRGTVSPVDAPPFGDFAPEAAVAFEGDRVLLASDDGDRMQEGYRCGKTKPESARRFRGQWLRLTRR